MRAQAPQSRHAGQPAARSFARTRSTITCGRSSMAALTRITAPARLFQQRHAVDVPRSLPPIGPVLDAVVLDGDLPSAPAHVDPDPKLAERDLGLRPRKPDRGPGSAAVWSPEATRRHRRPGRALVAVSPNHAPPGGPGHRHDVADGYAGGVQQRVDGGDRELFRECPPEVECRARRRRRIHAADQTQLFGRDVPGVDGDARRGMPVARAGCRRARQRRATWCRTPPPLTRRTTSLRWQAMPPRRARAR